MDPRKVKPKEQKYCSVYPSTWRRQWHPIPVLLPGKSHGPRSLMGCSPWGCWGSDTTEQLPFHFSLSRIGEGNGNLLHCSCLENPRDVGAWWVAVYGVAQSRTRLKWLSSILQHPVCLAGVLPWVRHFWLKYLYDAWCLSSHEYPPTKSTCSPGQPLIIIRFPLFLCLLGTSVLLCIL